MPEYRDDAYWDPFAECWVACTKPVLVNAANPPLTDPNVLYGDRYGVDWVYGEPVPTDAFAVARACKPSQRGC